MWIHFDTEEEARVKLEQDGFEELPRKGWISSDNTLKAHIHPIVNSLAVAVSYFEINSSQKR